MRITVLAVAAVVALAPHASGQDEVAYCTDLFPDTYSMRQACIEQERAAKAALAASGDLRQTFADRDAVRVDLARFDEAVIAAWNGPGEVGTFAEARAQLPPRHTLACVYPRGGRGGNVRNCVIRSGGRTVALFWISSAP